MKYYRIKCEIYKAEGKSWERMAEELLLSAVRRGGKEYGGKKIKRPAAKPEGDDKTWKKGN